MLVEYIFSDSSLFVALLFNILLYGADLPTLITKNNSLSAAVSLSYNVQNTEAKAWIEKIFFLLLIAIHIPFLIVQYLISFKQ